MRRYGPKNNSSQKLVRAAWLLSGAVMAFWIAGCSAGTSSSTPVTPQQVPQTYFAPYIAGLNVTAPQSFFFDDVNATFSQETFTLNPPQQTGSQVLNFGSFTSSQRGLLSLGITTTYSPNEVNIYVPQNYKAPGLLGSFAVELAGQAGGLVQLVGQPAEPLVAATQCPSFTTAQTYQFVSIPNASFDATTDTAFGSVGIVSGNGGAVTFQNINQFTLPPVGGPGMPGMPGKPLQPSAMSTVTGACGSTSLGSVTVVPGQYVVTNPGGFDTNVPPQAITGVGPTGLLVEDNGNGHAGTMPGTNPAITYENLLGAGNGAVGLPKPSSAIDTSAITGAQYLGFINAAGSGNGLPASHVASFGFAGSPALPAACSTFATQTGKLVNGIYGGDFPQNNGQDNPSASPDGFGNCDFAIDLGTQDDNGLYAHATVWVGTGYAGYTGSPYHFSAVAIAGQLNDKSKNAIFLIGVDSTSTQPWSIYLLQSN